VVNVDKKKRSKSFKMENETIARIGIIAAQSFSTHEQVMKKAVDLLYEVIPEDRNARIDLDSCIQKLLDTKKETDNVGEESNAEGE